MKIWEDYITLKSAGEPSFELLGPASEYFEQDLRKGDWGALDYQEALKKDTFALPTTNDREGYYGPDHFSYWASGLMDTNMLLEASKEHSHEVKAYMDFGCASGRVIRHFAVQHPEIKTYGCDINRYHVEWCNANLPQNSKVFQNHSIPSLPMEDNSLDLVSAFSVFTHIEAMETAWLMEIERVLRPGGIAWITVHTEGTLHDMDETWPLWKPVMDHPEAGTMLDENRDWVGDRMIMRWSGEASYASNAFYKKDYLMKTWNRFFDIAKFSRRTPSYQDVLILRKRG